MHGLDPTLTKDPVLKNLKTDSGGDVAFKHLVLLESTPDMNAGNVFDIHGMNDKNYTININGDLADVSRQTMRLQHRGLAHAFYGEMLKINKLDSMSVLDAGEIVLGHRCDTCFEQSKQINKKLVVIENAIVVVNGISMIVNGVGYVLEDYSYQIKSLTFYAKSDKTLKDTDEAVFIRATKDVDMPIFHSIMHAHFMRVGRLTSFRRDFILDCLDKHYPNKALCMSRCDISDFVKVLAEEGQMSDLTDKEIRVILQIVISNYDYYKSIYRGWRSN